MRPRNPTVRFALFGRGTDAPTVHMQTKPAGHRVRSGSTFRRCAGPRHSPPRLCRTGRPQPGKKGSLPPNDRIVPSTGMRPFTETSSFRPSLRTGLDFGKASRHNIESFPYEPDGKSIRSPENRCAPPCKRNPKRPKGERTGHPSPVERRSSLRLPLLRNHPPEYIFTGQLSDKQERKTSEGGQNRHRNTPPTLPRTGSRNSVQKSRNTQLQRAKKTAGQNCESQHTEPRFPKRIFASCRSRSSRVKREFRIRPPSCPQCCDCTQNGKGTPALRRTVVRRSPPPFSARFHPHSPVLRRYLPKNETTQGARSGTTPHTAVKHP